jgi:hypothetical protein
MDKRFYPGDEEITHDIHVSFKETCKTTSHVYSVDADGVG